MTLTFYAETPFADPRISEGNLISYTTDHLERMRAAKLAGNPLAERIEATQAAYDAFQETLNADLVEFGRRKGAKQTKRNFRGKHLRQHLERFEGMLRWTARDLPGNPVLLLFPQGRDAVTQMTDDLLKIELKRIADTLRDTEPALPPEVVAEADALLADWLEIYDRSEKSTATKKKTEEDKRATRKTLSWELYLNILEIARLFPNDKRAIERFSVQSLAGFTKPRGG